MREVQKHITIQTDESLKKWKESLGVGRYYLNLGADKSGPPPSDPRKVIVMSLALEVTGRPGLYNRF
jgi:hypothetical protein